MAALMLCAAGVQADCPAPSTSTATVTLTRAGFSVSAGKRVIFAPGNLQATTTDLGSTWTWAFAEHQYDFIGNNTTTPSGNGNTAINGDGTVSANGTVDLFGWNGNAAANNNHGIYNSTNNADYGNVHPEALKEDWGVAAASYIGAGWRTLTKDEWVYLFGRESRSLFALCKITISEREIHGMILLPDGWVSPAVGDIAAKWTAATAINNTAWGEQAGWVYYATAFTEAEWSAMEAAGAVFLPAAGYRSGTTVHLESASSPSGTYWSSTSSSATNAYRLLFRGGLVTPQGGSDRYLGRSVRLVQELQ